MVRKEEEPDYLLILFISLLVISAFFFIKNNCLDTFVDYFEDIPETGYMVITKRFGRFGNNVKQTLNMMYYAKQEGYKIKFGSKYNELKWLFDTKEMVLNFNNKVNWTSKDKPTIKSSSNFYYIDDLIDRLPTAKDHFPLAIEFLRPFIKINLQPASSNILYIHIRSVDIFNPDKAMPPHPEYVKPPLSFYTKIMKNSTYSKYVIVTEPDKRNPILHHLEKMKNVEIQSLTFKEDYTTLLQAKNIVMSNSSMLSSILYLSDNVKNVYVIKDLSEDGATIIMNYYPSNLKVYKYTFTQRYMKIWTDIKTKERNRKGNGDWKNTKEQNRLMVTYPEEGIKSV